jgi:hypothetical protein
MSPVQKVNARLRVVSRVELPGGAVLPVGETFKALAKQVGVHVLGAIHFQDREYTIRLSDSDLQRLGGAASPGTMSTPFDVTEHVRQGRMVVVG